MKFRIVNSCLLPADEYSLGWIREVEANRPDFVELFSNVSKRTKAQNRKSWAMFNDFAESIPEFHGYPMEPEDWKDLLASAFKRQTMLPGLDGGLVAIPPRTSRFVKGEFADFIESVYAYGSEHGVKWSEPALKFYEETMRGSEK